MKIILLEDVDKLGSAGEVVTVKDGFGRNFLIPRKLAVVATRGAVKAREEEERQVSRKRTKQRDDALAVARDLTDVEVEIPARVGEENRIFGTVTAQQVATALEHQGFKVDRRRIELNEEIRLIGVYTATAKLFSDVSAQFKVRVVPLSDE
jgi:large subunit ribosomal protein L9